jgi:RHS repeat-associated protein
MNCTQLAAGGCRLTADLFYMASDHLSSASLMMDTSGTTVSSQRYLPFGEVRTDVGSTNGITQTDLGYTGQRNYASFGLMDFNARFYSPSLGRFTLPDTIIPGATNTQSWNRYTYVDNSPILYNDPTGHLGQCPDRMHCRRPHKTSTDNSGNNSGFAVILAAGRDTNSATSSQTAQKDYNNMYPLESIDKQLDTLGVDQSDIHRYDENLFSNKYAYAQEIASVIENSDQFFILIGHSAGADAIILAFELLSEEAQSRVVDTVLLDPNESAELTQTQRDALKSSESGTNIDKLAENLAESAPTFQGECDLRHPECDGYDADIPGADKHKYDHLSHKDLASNEDVADEIIRWLSAIIN